MNFNFNTETKETKGFTPLYLSYGVNLVKFNGYELKTAKTGKIQIKLLVEGPEVSPDFEGADIPGGGKAKGLVSKVSLGIYMDLNVQAKADYVTNNLMYIAKKAGVANEVAAIQANSLEDLLDKFIKVIKGKQVWMVFRGEEYDKGKFSLSFKEGKVGKDSNGNAVWQVFCKHKDFAKTFEKDADDRILKAKGVNVEGGNIGGLDTLSINTNSAFDLKLYEEADSEDNEDLEDLSSDIDNVF